jgi:hypothetical protein
MQDHLGIEDCVLLCIHSCIQQIFLEHSYTKHQGNLKQNFKIHQLNLNMKRINLEGNTHAQEINVSQCPA